MAAPYSMDLRSRVLAAYDRGMRTGAIAEMFDVSPAWARRVRQRRREHNETGPRRQGSPGYPKIDRKHLAKLVEDDPDATLAELRDRLESRFAISSIDEALGRLGLTLKKRRSTPLSRRVRTLRSAATIGARGACMPTGAG